MFFIRTAQCAQDRTASLYAKRYHIDGDATVVVPYLAPLHRGLDDEFGMSGYPAFPLLIAVIHSGKGNDKSLFLQQGDSDYELTARNTPNKSQGQGLFRVLRAASP